MKSEKKPWEFSKRLAVWSILIATITVLLTYGLAFIGRETASDVTIAVFTGCIGYLVTYAGKSAVEKISRNRHGLDSEGNPFELNSAEV